MYLKKQSKVRTNRFPGRPSYARWLELNDDLPGEVLFMDVHDGATQHDGVGARVVLPKKHIFPYYFFLTQLCFDNVAKYQALILSLQMTTRMGIKDPDIYGDL